MTAPDLRPDGTPRRPLRPLHGIPDAEARDRTGIVASALFHGALILAFVLPTLLARSLIVEEQQGAGGPGPVGGGGGGARGTGAMRPERIRYIQIAPTPAAITLPTPTVVPPPPKEPEPVVPTPQAAPDPVPTPLVPTEGVGGGTGTDGTAGNGPGRGGGIGTGEGTGTGSATGPGTGGGGDQIYPPTVTNLPILPLPVPNRVRPYKMVAQFEVDERGNARLLGFNPSRDSGYNRKVREMLSEVRFRAAHRADGTPVRDTTYITAEAPR
jgi:protein TonB